MKFVLSLALAATAAAPVIAGDAYPRAVNSSNRFDASSDDAMIQRWIQFGASDIDAMVFEFVGSDCDDIMLTSVTFPDSSWSAVSRSSGLFIGFGSQGAGGSGDDVIRFNLTFTGFNQESSDEHDRSDDDDHHDDHDDDRHDDDHGDDHEEDHDQVFTWRVSYFQDGQALYGWEWSNSGDDDYDIGGGFGGRFDYLDINDPRLARVIPLPSPALMAGLAIGGIAIKRRRRSA